MKFLHTVHIYRHIILSLSETWSAGRWVAVLLIRAIIPNGNLEEKASRYLYMHTITLVIALLYLYSRQYTQGELLHV